VKCYIDNSVRLQSCIQNVNTPLIANGLDWMYHQLAEIQAIAASQLVECARSH
jgi:hypothetical protein